MPSYSEFERLFLLEFFVDYISIQNIAFNYAESTLCVSFQFLHYPVMRICEEDFEPKRSPEEEEDSKIVFKTGKSCLFSVHPDENNKISSSFNLVIAVCQKMKGCDKRALIGQAAIDLGSSFVDLLKTPLEADGAFGKNSNTKRDTFPLKDKFKRVVGGVAAFTCLSNCGKIIITQMQLADEEKNQYMFQGTNQRNLFKHDPMMNFPIIERVETKQDEKPQSQRLSQNTKKKLPRPKEVEESEGTEDSGNETGTETETTQDEDSSTKFQEEELKDKEEKFKEFSAEINGNSIMIRVLKKRREPKKEDDQPPICCCPPPEPPICPNAPKLNVCSCDYPLPPELEPRCPAQCCMLPQLNPPPQQTSAKKRKQKKGQITRPDKSILLQECPIEDCPLNLFKNSLTGDS